MEQIYYYLAGIFIVVFALVAGSQIVALILRIYYWLRLRTLGVKLHSDPGFPKVPGYKKIFRQPWQFLKLGLLTLIVTVVTVYVCLSALVLITKQPLPFVESVQAFPAENTIQKLLQNKYLNPQGSSYDALGNNRTFTVLKLPRLNLRLDLLPFITDRQGDYLNRLNSGHYFFISDTATGKPNDLVIYLTQNWRSILYPDQLQEGDNIFLQKDDGSTVMFKIIDKKQLDFNGDYLPQQTNNLGLILIVSDPANHTNYFFRGEYVDVNNTLTVN
jgi:hypothetical protein